MNTKLFKTKWYPVDLDTKQIVTSRVYENFWKGADAETELGTLQNFTILRGSHLLEHLGKPWILPEETPQYPLRISDYAHMGVRAIESAEPTTDSWYDLCDRAYEAEAVKLVAQGFERRDRKGPGDGFYPAIFVGRDRTLVLVRRLGSSAWYPSRLPGV